MCVCVYMHRDSPRNITNQLGESRSRSSDVSDNGNASENEAHTHTRHAYESVAAATAAAAAAAAPLGSRCMYSLSKFETFQEVINANRTFASRKDFRVDKYNVRNDKRKSDATLLFTELERCAQIRRISIFSYLRLTHRSGVCFPHSPAV